MTRVNITESWIAKLVESSTLRDDESDRYYWDVGLKGFGVRLGRRFATFIVQHRVNGRQVKTTIGRYRELGAGADGSETWTVKRARDEAIRLLAGMSRGIDPESQPRLERRRQRITLADACALYLEKLRDEGGRFRSIDTVEREIADRGDDRRQGSHLKAWLDRPLVSIDGEACREHHREITKEHGPHIANRVMRHLRAIWNHVIVEAAAGTLRKYGIDKGTVFAANPTIAVKWNTERAGKLVQRRQQPIPWQKLPAWHAAVIALGERSKNERGELRLGSPLRRDYNLIVLLTGLRRNDAATIRWEHVNLTDEPAPARVWCVPDKDWQEIVLPPHTMIRPSPKGGAARSFQIPLSTQVVEILERRQRDNVGDNGWVFPTEALKSDKERVRPCYLCADLGMPPHEKGAIIHIAEPKEHDEIIVSPHRLRDTYTTALADRELGISGYVIDVLTNHRPPKGSVTAGYINFDVDSLRAAQQAVSDFLMARTVEPKSARGKLALVK